MTKDKLAPITDARFIVALVLLLVNDHLLKELSPGVLTGKLSDFAGLVVLPVLVGVILNALAIRRAHEIACVTVGVWFAAMKTLAPVALATERIFESVTGSPSSIVVDPTDLVGLAALALAVKVLCDPRPLVTRRTLRGGLLLAAVVACAATSEGGGTPQDLGVDREGRVIDGGEYGSGTPEDYSADKRQAGMGLYETEACLDEDDGGDCFRIVGGKVQRLDGNGDWKTEWSISNAPQIAATVGHGLGTVPSMRATDIVTTSAGTVHVAFDGIWPIERSAAGVWTPPPHTFRPVAMFLVLLLVGFGGVALTDSARNHGIASALAVSATLIAIMGALAGLGAFLGGVLAVAALGVGLSSAGSGKGLAVSPIVSAIGLIGGLAGLMIWRYWLHAPYLLSIASVLIGGGIVVLGLFIGPSRLSAADGSGPQPTQPNSNLTQTLRNEVGKINGSATRPASVPWSVAHPTNEQLEAAVERAAATIDSGTIEPSDTSDTSEDDGNQDPPLPSAEERAAHRARLNRRNPDQL